MRLLVFILPSYVANSAPVFFGGGEPVDKGKNFLDGKRIFGSAKTVRGLLAGVSVGTLAALLLALADNLYLPQLAFREKAAVGLLLPAGTMAGDLLGSFVKRRLGIPQGARHEFFDQLLFLGVALLFASPYYLPAADEIVFLIIVTYALHRISNLLAHRLNLKNVPW